MLHFNLPIYDKVKIRPESALAAQDDTPYFFYHQAVFLKINPMQTRSAMKKKTLSKTVAMAIVSSGLISAPSSVLAATATVYYNKYLGSPDGWVTNTPDFTGLNPGQTPFGYTGKALNWAVHAAAGSSATVSEADALSTYGFAADIDTAKGAWNDGYPGTTNANTGWGHMTDIGLFKSDIDQNVTISIASVSGDWNNFGISIFKGMDSGQSYNHHGQWNSGYCPGCTPPSQGTVTNDNPLGMTGLNYLTHSDNSTVTFTAQGGEIYSILLGGYAGSGIFSPVDGYVAQITTSPVPLPAAAWLMGGTLVGLTGFLRRTKAS